MRYKKLFLIPLLILLTATIPIPSVKAANIEMINWTDVVGHDHLVNEHPTATAYSSASGQCFNATYTGHLTNVQFYLKAYGNIADFWLTVKLCNTTANGDGLAPGTEIASSTTFINGASIDGVTGAWYSFAFWDTALIYAGTKYALYIYNYGADGSTSNNLQVHRGSAVGDPALSFRNIYASGVWYHYDPQPVYALKVTIHDSVEPDATPGPTTTSAPPSGGDALFTQFTNFLVPLITMLIPSFLLWWIGGRTKWPFLIGLAIGTGLGYMFIANFPSWLVFLVAIGLIGMAYQDVRGAH